MIDFTNIKAITIPEGEVIKITCDGEPLWEAPKKDPNNIVNYATAEPGGTEIYNKKGYADNHRWNAATNAIETQEGYRLTGWMPAKPGVVYQLQNFNMSYTEGYVICYTSTSTYEVIEFMGFGPDYDLSTDTYSWSCPKESNYSYIRFQGSAGDNKPIIIEELYNPDNITLGKRYSGTPGSLSSSAAYFITDFIAVKPGDVLTVESDGSFVPTYAGGAPKVEKIAYYNNAEVILASVYAETSRLRLEQLNNSTVRYHIGYQADGSIVDYFQDIAYIRFCLAMPETATAAHAARIKSIRNIIA